MPASSNQAVTTRPLKGKRLTVTLEASPDFGRVVVEYEPKADVIEPGSLTKLLAELDSESDAIAVIDAVAEVLFAVAKPHRLSVVGVLHPVGGVGVSIRAERGAA